MLNKKGQFQFTTATALFFLILSAGAIILLSFAFSSHLRYIIIGMGVLIGFFILLAQAMSSEFTTPKIIVLLSVLTIGIFFIIGSGILQTAFGDTFVKPSWARLECLPTDAYEVSNNIWLDQQSIFNCNFNTEECRFRIKDEPSASCINPLDLVTGYYQICSLNGENCGSQISYKLCGGTSSDWIFINNGQSVKFATGILIGGEDKTKITFEYKPWKLYRIVGGSKWIVNSQSCDITSGDKSKILFSENVDKLYRQGGEGLKWINYVDDWNYGPATNIVDYNGQEAYCTAGAVYSIVKLKMADGSMLSLDPTYSSSTQSGDLISGLGNRIAYVECCPNEPNCGSDFTYKKIDSSDLENKQCTSDLQCYNAGGRVPIDLYNYVTYNCYNNKCVKSSPTKVECTSSSACPFGKICDLSTTNYGKCITQSTGEYCGDGICQLSETSTSCLNDCGENNIKASDCIPFLQTYSPAGESTYSFLFFKKTVNSEPTCKTAPTALLIIFFIFVILIITIVLLIKKKK